VFIFQGASGSYFPIDGARWPRKSAVTGVRLSLPVQGVNLFARYDGMLANSASIHGATAGLLISF
jgi:uncharacterized protein with beta-barrel porin domain